MPTLSLSPSFPIIETTRVNIIETSSDSGMVQRRKVHPIRLRSFEFLIDPATSTEASTIRTLFTNTAGQGLTFDYIPVGESTALKMLFVNGSMVLNQYNAGVYRIYFEMKQTRNH